MEVQTPKGAYKILTITTLTFTLCFAIWMLNGVLVTFLTSNQVYDWSLSDIGLLIGLPVLTGSLMRLPAGILTDRFGGKPVMIGMLILCAIPLYSSIFSRPSRVCWWYSWSNWWFGRFFRPYFVRISTRLFWTLDQFLDVYFYTVCCVFNLDAPSYSKNDTRKTR